MGVNKEKNNHKSTINRLLIYVKPYIVFLLIAIIGSLMLVGINLYVSEIISSLVESVGSGDYANSQKNIYIIIGITIVGGIVSYIVRLSSGKFSIYTIRDIRKSIYEHIENINIQFIDNNHTGEIISRLSNDISVLQEFFENNMRNFIYHPLLFVGSFILLIRINCFLLLVSISTMLIAIGITFLITAPVKKKIRYLQKDIAKVNSVYQDSILGINVIKTYNLYTRIFNKYDKLLNITLKKSLDIEKINSLLVPIGTILSIVPILVSILLGGYMCVTGNLDTGELIAFIYLLDFISSSAGVLPSLINEYKSVLGVSAHLFEILDEPLERQGGREEIDISNEYPIVFDSVKFSYNSKDTILNNLSFKVKKGATTALVGHSGSGKSTIIKLICGFYNADEGQVLLWGQNINELNLKNVRSNISIVSQDVYLFPGTIAENIAYDMGGISIKEIIDAAKAANAHEFIINLPQKYNTKIGERGNSLSGGQKQRISIARAILKKSPLVLLDEPTSALDIHSELCVQKSLEILGESSTVIVIAHRMSTIRNADEIILLDKGEIIDKGTHDYLIENNNIYADLYKGQRQKSGYKKYEEN